MNTFLNQLKNDTNYMYTENGGVAYSTTNSAVYDLFAFGASYRSRSDDDCIFLFKKAFEQDSILALKCLFWIRDCRGGAGERRFFRVCLKWLANNYPEIIERNLEHIPFFGRWDDLYSLVDTPLENKMFSFIKNQLTLDMKDCVNSN